MTDRKLVSHSGHIPAIEFPAWAQRRPAVFRAVRLDERGVVLFELIQPVAENPKTRPFKLVKPTR